VLTWVIEGVVLFQIQSNIVEELMIGRRIMLPVDMVKGARKN